MSTADCCHDRSPSRLIDESRSSSDATRATSNSSPAARTVGSPEPVLIEISTRRPGSADTSFQLTGAELTKAIDDDGGDDFVRLTLTGDRCPP
jgi:hypothetical protein